MALVTFKGVLNADGTTTITKSTDNNGTSADAALIVDNTISALRASRASSALLRAWRREMAKVSTPAGVPTTGTSVE